MSLIGAEYNSDGDIIATFEDDRGQWFTSFVYYDKATSDMVTMAEEEQDARYKAHQGEAA